MKQNKKELAKKILRKGCEIVCWMATWIYYAILYSIELVTNRVDNMIKACNDGRTDQTYMQYDVKDERYYIVRKQAVNGKNVYVAITIIPLLFSIIGFANWGEGLGQKFTTIVMVVITLFLVSCAIYSAFTNE